MSRRGITNKNKLIQHVYGEMDAVENGHFEEKMEQYPALWMEIEGLAEAKAYSELAEVCPSERVIARVLAYARHQEPPQKSTYFDKTHAH